VGAHLEQLTARFVANLACLAIVRASLTLVWYIAPFTEVHFIGGLSLECRIPCLSILHHDSIMLLENTTSTWAMIRWIVPLATSASTCVLRFSTPLSMYTLWTTPFKPMAASINSLAVVLVS
jgi:hypothetical protein